MGARPLGRVIQEHIKRPLADAVLFGVLKKGGTVKVSVETNEAGEIGLKLDCLPDPALKRKVEEVDAKVGDVTLPPKPKKRSPKQSAKAD